MFAVSGNAKTFKRNGSLTNSGILSGGITAKGIDTTTDPKNEGDVITEGEGNGALSVGYSPFSNKRDVDKAITSVKNSGLISGKADIKGSSTEIQGTIKTYGVGNGIGALAIADFGEAAVGGSGGDTGIVDGIAGGSRSVRAISIRSVRSRRSVNFENSPKKEIDPAHKPADADFNGKNNKISIGDISNSGNIEGKIKLTTAEGKLRPTTTIQGVSGVVQPQWRDINAIGSANGIGARAYVNTVDKITFSEDKENTSAIGNIKNKLTIEGNAEFKTGNKGTITNIRSTDSGNGISSSAFTGNFAKNKTIAKIGSIENEGEIKGYNKSEVGSNSATGYMEFSNAIIKGSGNGISTYSRNSNGQVKESIARIGTVNNKGNISGEIFAKVGSGYGEDMAQIESSGNGIAVFKKGSYRTVSESSLGKVENMGMILGKAIVYGGKDKISADANMKDKLHTLPIYEKSVPSGTSDNYIKSPEEARTTIVLKEISEKRLKLSNLSKTNSEVKNKILSGIKKYYKENAVRKVSEIDNKILENKNKLGKEKDKLKWLQPGTSGYEAKQKDIENLKNKNKNLEKEKETIENRKIMLVKATELSPEIQDIYNEKVKQEQENREKKLKLKKMN